MENNTVKNRKKVSAGSENGLMEIIAFRYLPYWPLFLLLIAIFLVLAFILTSYQQPSYNVQATIIVNDQARGAGEAEPLRTLNVYSANKIVENEVQVLNSRTLINEVVNRLYLYAPVFEKGKVKPTSAYTTSPIKIKLQASTTFREQKEIYFEFKDSSVHINNKVYPLNKWITFPFGVLQFIPNPRYAAFSVRPLYFNLVDPKKVIESVAAGLQVGTTSKLSTVINIGYKDEVPQRGEDIVNSLLNAYTNFSLSNNNQLASNTLAFVDERLRGVEQDIDSIQRRIQQFRSSQGVVDLSEQGRIHLQTVAENNRRSADINMELAVLDQVQRYVASRDRRVGIVPTSLGINDPVLADLLQRLNELELQLANSRTVAGENNPATQSIESEIAKIRPHVQDIVTNQRQRLQASRNNLAANTGTFTGQLRNIPQQERELLEISRQLSVLNNIHESLLQRREEAALSSASTIPDSRIIDYAHVDPTPAGSKRPLILAAALIGAIVVGIVYVFMREGMKGSVLFRPQLQKLTSLPIWGEIIYRPYKKQSFERMAMDPLLVSQFYQLQASLGLYQKGSSQQTFLVTSSNAGEGKSFISNHFAVVLGSAGKKVLLLDADFTDLETTALHRLKNEEGLSNILVNGLPVAKAIRQTSFVNVDILPTGTSVANPLELLTKPEVEALFTHLKSRYDYILIDSPSLELVTTAYALALYCDSTLMIIRHGLTDKNTLKRMAENRRVEQLPNCGILFNGIRARGFLRRYYGYGYGYGYEGVLPKFRRPGIRNLFARRA